MRAVFFVFALACIAICCSCAHTNAGTKASSTSVPGLVAAESPAAANSPKPSARVDFPTQIKPILSARCQPCHFNGGKVYSSMPFDRPETIKRLGTKLFTRIKAENERRLISDFLAQ
jgi:hypothetical protein